jgi:predicted kinase
MEAQRTVIDIDQAIMPAPFFRPNGSLLVMMGLPGTGKSLIVEQLQKLMPAAVISTDAVRRHLRQNPTYTAAEMMYVYELCHQLIERRLGLGQRVVFDGTNHVAARRQQLMSLAQRRGAPFALCHVQAAERVIQERLAARKGHSRRDGDLSDAGWPVYQWMVAAQEPITIPHLTLDTTGTPPEALAQRLSAYWQEAEAEAASV